MIKSVLMAIARAVLQGVISALAKQVARVFEEVTNPMQAIIKMVTDGVWRGQGADKFVDVISSMIMPGIDDSCQKIDRMKNNLGTARDTIDQADADAEGMVRSRLYDGFNFYQG